VVARVRRHPGRVGGPDGGRLAIIAPDALISGLSGAIGEATAGDRPESLDAVAALLTVRQAKGLEFDRVVLVDPAGIITLAERRPRHWPPWPRRLTPGPGPGQIAARSNGRRPLAGIVGVLTVK